ncbi:jg1686 [Pararge aegeria aegeria]|uniref:Jg1685 protein n=1 Tax=Pararge aegeria aegeria TaxID=348720 RepID=A0A8S4RD28_9NEOP|nr:jg1685 [Pararge aegeria aegeria]CAH2234546.1 jg1686 [Pararge aegeria aegeria]
MAHLMLDKYHVFATASYLRESVPNEILVAFNVGRTEGTTFELALIRAFVRTTMSPARHDRTLLHRNDDCRLVVMFSDRRERTERRIPLMIERS